MEKEKNSPKKSKKLANKIAYWVLLGFFCLVFIGSGIYVADYLIRSGEAGQEYDDLQDLYVPPSRPPIPDATDPTPPTDPTTPGIPTMLPELVPIYERNQELVGWITVPGTKISYPVLQSPSRPDYYLYRTFEGMRSDWGAIYAREACDIFKPSDNITIYGHHMKDGSMFSGLDGYKRQSFWQDHQYIYFDTLYERHVYQVIAAFKTSGTYGNGYAYHLFADAKDEADFNQFISTVKSLAYYDTGISAQYGDKLITLSTCEYTIYENGEAVGRHVVVAKRIY